MGFDAFSGPANIDLLMKAEDENGPIVIGIEAKADETFGSTVGKTLSQAQDRLRQKPRSKGVERIRQLATTFGLDLSQREVLNLRYQLLTITAATLAEAHRQSAQRAVVIVHEFARPSRGSSTAPATLVIWKASCDGNRAHEFRPARHDRGAIPYPRRRQDVLREDGNRHIVRGRDPGSFCSRKRRKKRKLDNCLHVPATEQGWDPGAGRTPA